MHQDIGYRKSLGVDCVLKKAKLRCILLKMILLKMINHSPRCVVIE